ncbi:hypothetical protein [Ignavibacterium sp.]|uniref:hypothetical protein n=1 Tax=Ignavibacterium sp. TaxID=2651167 RepID=UPI0021FBEC54|nr:hypothetical protein [Ignavibacterium sp.]BDQ02791.1 MAG: hypothetical protein KatS3mg037_1366 [Ignavibacterium sp.]
MKKEEIKLLADIYADPDLVTPEEIEKELNELGFNYNEFITALLDKIIELKREALYNEGREKIVKYSSLLSGLKEKLKLSKANNELEVQIKLAFNKQGDLTEEDIEEILLDQKKLLLLKDFIDKQQIE